MPAMTWPFAYLLYLGVGISVSLILKYGSRPRFLRWLGQRPFCSPNWVSLWRIPIIWYGQGLFITADGSHLRLFTGFMLVVVGLMLDHLDGKMAKNLIAGLKKIRFLTEYNGNIVITHHHPEAKADGLTADNQLWAWFEEKETNKDGVEVRHRYKVVLEEWVWMLMAPYTRVPMFKVEMTKNGFDRQLVLTGIGEWLDPLIDKLNFHPLFCYFAYTGLLNGYVVAAAVSIDLFGTILRTPFIELPGLRRFENYVREVKATPIGKSKVVFQFCTLLAIMPAAAHWLTTEGLTISYYITSSILAIADVIALGSVISRLTLREMIISSREGKRSYGLLRRFFDHDVEEK